MEQLKGGTRKHPPKRVVKDSSAHAPEATVDDIEVKVKVRRIVEGQPSLADQVRSERAPSKIEVKASSVKSVVPGHVFRCGSFKWNPQTFVTESEQLNNKFIDSTKQTQGLEQFLRNPRLPMIYAVAGNPDDMKAKLFAAYLVAHHIKILGFKSNVIWQPMYGGFDNKLVTESEDKAQPTMIVLTNLTPNATNTKLEKARDILEHYPDIPRVVVSCGMDPVSFMSTRLYSQVNALAYFSEALVRQRMEVI